MRGRHECDGDEGDYKGDHHRRCRERSCKLLHQPDHFAEPNVRAPSEAELGVAQRLGAGHPFRRHAHGSMQPSPGRIGPQHERPAVGAGGDVVLRPDGARPSGVATHPEHAVVDMQVDSVARREVALWCAAAAMSSLV